MRLCGHTILDLIEQYNAVSFTFKGLESKQNLILLFSFFSLRILLTVYTTQFQSRKSPTSKTDISIMNSTLSLPHIDREVP